MVRRLATPQPPRSDETETLPVVDDSIFATFTGELDQIGPNTPKPRSSRSARSSRDSYSSDPAGEVPGLADPPSEPKAPWPLHRSALARLPDGRVMLLAGAGGLVVLLIVVVALISGNGSGGSAATPTLPKSTVPVASEEVKGRKPDGLKELDGDAASQLLTKAGVSAGGTIVDAWDWTDQNGHNLVATVISPAANGKETLRVVHVARLDTNPKLLRVMRDPDLPNCSGGGSGGTAGFTKNGLLVRDLNGDNIAEVLVGWESSCGGKDAKSEVKLALLSNGQKYIIRGNGVIGKSGTSKPDPRSSRWPATYRTAAELLYHQLYF